MVLYIENPKDSIKKLLRLEWLSGLSASLRTKGSLVQFPIRAHAWVSGQVGPPGGGVQEATTH